MNREIKQNEAEKMKRVAEVIRHPLFETNLESLQELEADRKFCRHGMDHLMDVARLMYIFAMERGIDIAKDVLYAAGLVHDIGRSRQYMDGTPHAYGGLEAANTVLWDAGFDEDEIGAIVRAVSEHNDRAASHSGMNPLSELLYDADKMSRDCYACRARKQCKWSEDEKNNTVIW